MFPALPAELLRAREIDAIAIAERSDLRSMSDEEVLAAAARDGRVAVTFNYRDFILLDGQRRTSGAGHNGIVIVNARRFSNSKSGVVKIVDALEGLVKSERKLTGIVSWL